MSTPLVMTTFTEAEFKLIVRNCIREEMQAYFSNPGLEFKNEKMLNQKDLIEKLGVSKQTIIKWTQSGVLKAQRIGRRVFYRKEDVQENLKNYLSLSTRQGFIDSAY